jgi:hypothetical protein
MNPEDALRQALEARADRVRVDPDALGTIRRRIAGRRAPRYRNFTWGLAYVATGTVAAVALVVALTLPRERTTPPGLPSGGSHTTSPAPTAVVDQLPVYFVGQADGRPVLYREYHTATMPDTLEARIRAALGVMLRGGATDRDYTSPWPRGASVRSVRLSGSASRVAEVDLTGVSRNDVGASVARAAVQQLVWTVTAVTADENVQLTGGVRLFVDGARVTTLWGDVDVSGELTRADAQQTLAQVWLITPQQGDTVRSPFTVQVYGTVPVGTLMLRVSTPGGDVLQQQPVALDKSGTNRGVGNATLDLEPGRYTLTVYVQSPDGLTETSPDDHAITVN